MQYILLGKAYEFCHSDWCWESCSCHFKRKLVQDMLLQNLFELKYRAHLSDSNDAFKECNMWLGGCLYSRWVKDRLVNHLGYRCEPLQYNPHRTKISSADHPKILYGKLSIKGSDPISFNETSHRPHFLPIRSNLHDWALVWNKYCTDNISPSNNDLNVVLTN